MPETTTELKAEISALLKAKDGVGLRLKLTRWLPSDLAPIIADLPVEKLALLFRLTSREMAAATFPYLALEAQHRLLKLLTPEQSAALLNELSADDRTAFLDDLPLDLAMQLLSLLSPDERQVAQSLLAYPEHSVGRMMTLDYVAVHPEWSVRESLDYIRQHGYDRETLNVVYVVDDGGRLIDDVRVRRFLLGSVDRPVKELMDGNYAALAPDDDREKRWRCFVSLTALLCRSWARGKS
jgi:magnesium transporter